MRRTISSTPIQTTFAALAALGLAACSSGESADAPEGEGVNGGESTATEDVRTVPAGTSMTFRVQETVSTETHGNGDVFTATLVSDLTGANGAVLVPAGTPSRWMVTQASPNAGSEGEAVLAFRLEAVQFGNEWAPVQATVTEAQTRTSARDSGTETAAKVAVGAAAGAILGQIIGKNTESTLKGAGAGAAVGTVVALTTRGSKAVLPQGSTITVRLDEAAPIR